MQFTTEQRVFAV